MEREVHHIRTFELTGTHEALEKSHEALLRECGDARFAKREFERHHLFNELGRELSINQTKGRKCARIYYDEHDEILYIKVYDITGYIDYELNLDYPGKDEDGNARSAKDDGSPELDVFTNVFEDELYDAREAIANKPAAAQEVITSESGSIIHFKEIPASRWDVYIKDPLWLYNSQTGIETRFYDLGYKLTEVMTKDVDGIISGVRYMYYDANGIFQRRVFMCGTPWGGALVYDEEVWEYDFGKNTAAMIETSARKDTVLRRHEFELDELGRLKRKTRHERWHGTDAFGQDSNATQELKHYATEHYSYDKEGRLCEIITTYCLPGIGAERVEFEYDEHGRLTRQRDYRDKGRKEELIGEETYEYLTDTRVRVTSRVYSKEPRNDPGSGEQRA